MSRTVSDEFAFIASDAARVGVTPLPVRRVSMPAASAPAIRQLSALRYGDTGAGRPRLVFLHGAGLNAHSFDPLVFALGAPALALDLPGHGHSSWRDDASYTPEHLWPDVAAALESWTDTPVTLVGHSLGGLTALQVAANRPDLVSHLTLIDITPEVTSGEGAATVLEFIRGQRRFDSHEAMVDRAIQFGIGTDRDALRRGVVLNTTVHEDGTVTWIHHLAHLDAPPTLHPGDGPSWPQLPDTLGDNTVLVRASEGFVSEEAAASWRDHYPRSRVATVPGPHNLHETDPLALAGALRHLLPTQLDHER